MHFTLLAIFFAGATSVAANFNQGSSHHHLQLVQGAHAPGKHQHQNQRSLNKRRNRKRHSCKKARKSSHRQASITAAPTTSSSEPTTTTWSAPTAADTHTVYNRPTQPVYTEAVAREQPAVKAAETSPAQPAVATPDYQSNSNNSSDTQVAAQKYNAANLNGISGFRGSPNTGIGSWFRTSNPGDDTNGRSWCQLDYQDHWLGFAPNVQTMLGNYGYNLEAAAKAYCGLEATAYNPDTGMSATIYIVDGFDAKWVRTPDSVDLTLGAFKALYGSETSDKNVVIKNLQWTFTGNRKEEYSYNYGR